MPCEGTMPSLAAFHGEAVHKAARSRPRDGLRLSGAAGTTGMGAVDAQETARGLRCA